jgi:hypothetical protein
MVEKADDERDLFVVDPDDYQKTRKLKAINDAKAHVHKLRRDMPEKTTSSQWAGIHKRISENVALYGSELMPLIEDARERGILTGDDLKTEYGSLKEFVHLDGRIPVYESGELVDAEEASRIQYMAFYRQLDRIQRKLGLGLELEEDLEAAEI